MKVLIDASPIVSSGGSTRHLQNFLDYLNSYDSNNEYYIVVSNNIKNLINISKLDKLNFVYIDRTSTLNYLIYLFFNYKALIKKYKIDLIVSLVNIGFINPTVPQINFQRNPVIYYKGKYDINVITKIRNLLERNLLILVMNKSCSVITPTLAMQNMIKEFKGTKNINYVVLPHAINYKEIVSPSTLTDNILAKFNNGFIKVLYISHFMPHKNHMVLVEAIKILKQRNLNVKLYIIVDRHDWPSGYNTLIENIKKWNITDNIELLPRIKASEVLNLYRISDIFVFPSLCESFGFPLMEGMACKIPIIAANTDVNIEICGDSAVYFDANSSNDLADKLEDLITNADKRELYKNKGYDRFMDTHLEWGEYIELFEKIINNYDKLNINS